MFSGSASGYAPGAESPSDSAAEPPSTPAAVPPKSAALPRNRRRVVSFVVVRVSVMAPSS